MLPTQAAVKAMLAGGRGGRVLNISSVRGQLGINAGYSAYVAANGAIDSLTRQVETEWAKHEITVTAISAPFVATPPVATLTAAPGHKAGCYPMQHFPRRHKEVSILTRPEDRVLPLPIVAVVSDWRFQSSPGPKTGCYSTSWCFPSW